MDIIQVMSYDEFVYASRFVNLFEWKIARCESQLVTLASDPQDSVVNSLFTLQTDKKANS